jgi:hypothetical protein
MIREGNVLWSSGGSQGAHRASNVSMGVLPDARGLNATDVFEHTAIVAISRDRRLNAMAPMVTYSRDITQSGHEPTFPWTGWQTSVEYAEGHFWRYCASP